MKIYNSLHISNPSPQCFIKCNSSECFYYLYVGNQTYVESIQCRTHKDVFTTQVHTYVPNVMKTFSLLRLEDNRDNCARLI